MRHSKRLSKGDRRKRRNPAHDDGMEDGNEESEASNDADVARQRSEDVEEDESPSAERKEAHSQRGNARSGCARAVHLAKVKENLDPNNARGIGVMLTRTVL